VSTVERARELRKGMTDAERLLWSRLRRRQVHGLRFRPQHPIGPYIADFACTERRLVVELDGGQHVQRKVQDTARSRWLGEKGYRVLRFWNNDVLTNIDAVVHAVASATLPPPSPTLPPSGGGSFTPAS
jgi:very-short-patch-repair endonuclease